MIPKKEKSSFKQQFAALKNLVPFFKMVWATDKGMTVANVILRIIKSFIPLLMLYVGKEIVDEVIHLINIGSDDKSNIWFWLGIELGLAVLSEVMNRAITLVDSLLGDLFSNKSSEQLIQHAAKLDLYQFENAEFYDKLEMARRQTTGRTVLLSQVLTQMQDIVTVISLGAGLIYFNFWLILILALAVVPSFLGETHFNQRSYSLTRSWTPERRELDYLRFIGASDETAKEIKIFGLSDFIVERFRYISDKYFRANRSIATRRAIWGTCLSAIGTLAYYGAYVFIIIQTVGGLITVGTLTFLAGSFNRMRSMLQMIMNRFTKIAQEALYLEDYFDFLNLAPQITTSNNTVKFPTQIKEGFVFENVSFKYPSI